MTTTLAPPVLAFRVDAKPFAAAVAAVARRIPTKPPTPVLAGVLLDVTDGVLTVSAFDFDVSAQVRLDVDPLASNGRALVSGRLLAELVKTFPDKPVDVALDGSRVTVRCGSVRLGLPAMTAEDYPTLPALPAAIGTVDAAAFVTLVERVALAADRADDTAVPELTGVYLQLSGDRLEARATDRYRGAIGSIPWTAANPGADQAALVPVGVLTDIARTFADQTGQVAIHLDGTLAAFAAADRSVTARLLAGRPIHANLPTLMPPRGEAPAVVPVADLAAALRRAGVVGGPKAQATLTFTAGALTVGGHNETGDSETDETIAVEYDGPDARVTGKVVYLADALAALRSETVEMSLPADGRRKPVLVTAPADPDFRYFFMPVVKAAGSSAT